MAWEKDLVTINVKANADLSANQFLFHKINSSGKAVVAASAGERVFGVLQNKPAAADRNAQLAYNGVTKVKCGGTVTQGDPVTTDANGKAATATGGQYVVGYAIETGALNELIPIALLQSGSIPGLTQKVYSIWTNQVKLAKIAAADLITSYTPGFVGTIEKLSATVSDPATTAAKAATLQHKVAGAAVTGGALALTSANMTPLGNTVDASAITAGNGFTAAQALSLTGSSVTAFIEGEANIFTVLSVLSP